jgi:protein-tyrosine phosphatase
MLFFTKKKPYLKDLLGGNFVDIHSHLLPGIDDGAATIAATIQLTQSFLSLGISQWITTPHISHYVWDNSPSTVLTNYEQTIQALDRQQIPTPFRVAAEYFMDDVFARQVAAQNLLPLKDTYVLVEMSYINAPIQLYSLLFDLQLAGYIPVLAHPERYLFYHGSPQEYYQLKKAGCLFQLNLLATVGYYGKGVTQMAAFLLEKGLYDFAGTDVHHLRHIEAFNERLLLPSDVALKAVIAQNQFFKV